MEELQINGVNYALGIHQRDSSLPYLLMLHGFMGDSRAFNHLIEDLYKTCNPITVDLLGHGRSEKIYSPNRYREEEQVEDIISIISTIDVGSPFLYGYSMGGRLALKTAQSEPTLFNDLILESTNFGIPDDQKCTSRIKLDNERAEKIRRDFKAFLEHWETLALFQSPGITNNELSQRYKQIHAEQDPEAMAASLRGFGTGSMEPVGPHNQHYKGSVLLMAGSGDQKYIDINRKMKELFIRVETRILEAGHRVHCDNPQELSQAINLFIEQNSQL